MFAAKEACSKALGTGFRQGVFWRDMEVVHLRSGKPMDTYGRAEITKQGRRVATVRAEAWQEDRSRPIAAAHGHFLLKATDDAAQS